MNRAARAHLRSYLLVAAAIVYPAAAEGQVSNGSLEGKVYDPSEARVPNATIRLRAHSGPTTRSTVSGPTGHFEVPQIPPGIYDITVDVAGLTGTAQVEVIVGSRGHVDLRLSIDPVKSSMSVTAVAALVEVNSSGLGSTIDRTFIEKLPLNKRDFLQLALLSPGVAGPVQDSELSTRGSFAMHANGGREEFNNFMLDGIDNNDPNVNRYILQPPVEAIQEFQIATNSYSAEFGRSGAAQVNVVTRTGSSAHHGSVYEYLRNDKLDARNFFDEASKSELRRNQFGGNAGGPLVGDRTFYFGNVDRYTERRGYSRLATVPSLVERAGDLSGVGQPVVDPFTQAQFPGNRIPATRVAPLAASFLALFPLPNRIGPGPNYLSEPVARDDQWQANIRLDHRATTRDQIMVRYSFGKKDLFEPFAEESNSVPGFGDFLADTGHQGAVHYQRTIGTSTVNSLLGGVNSATRRLVPQNYTTDVNTLWGVNWLPTRSIDFGFPTVNVAGYSPVGDVGQLPIDRSVTSYYLADLLALTRGNHTIRLGGEFRRAALDGIVDVLARGSLSFSGALSGTGISDLLLGLPSFGIQSKVDNPQSQRSWSTGVFIQDDFKATPRLTLNAGLRYEFFSPIVDPKNQMNILDLGTGRLVQVGSEGVPRSGMRPDRNNFAPRFGFAWSPKDRLVIRGGYGIFYDGGMTVVNSSLYFNPPYLTLRVFFPTATSLLTVADPFPTSGGLVPPPSLNTLSPDVTTAYLQHWNLAVERFLPSIGTVQVAYAASKGTHLIGARDLNQPPPGPGPLETRRPYPQFGNIFFIESGANSSYQSLQISVNRRLTNSFLLTGAYTFSKSIDNASAFLGTTADENFPQDSHNYRAERGLSSFDVPHHAVIAYVYSLPNRWGWLKGIETRGIITAVSGQPFTPVLRFDNSNTGNTGDSFGSDRPDLLHNPKLSNPTPEKWFDTSAFAVSPPYTFGSAGRNVVRGPGLFTVDASVARRFRLGERAAILIEAQAFNLFNRANFHLPERFADEPATFGRILSAKPAREIQLAARIQF